MEMVSGQGDPDTITKKNLHMLHIDEGENPVSIQLFRKRRRQPRSPAEFIQEKYQDRYRRYQHGLPRQ